ncbi:peptidase M36 [Mycena leptocephala]|nr:peptidase M36 [Mycena leptocephala]
MTANINAVRVNVNTIHDLSHRYGFIEAVFNFQTNNFRNGGLGKDRVTISVQDNGGIDDAPFTMPPDGQSRAMRMFLWDFTNPLRDGSFENEIVVHEAGFFPF